jgi:hypothetical protein
MHTFARFLATFLATLFGRRLRALMSSLLLEESTFGFIEKWEEVGNEFLSGNPEIVIGVDTLLQFLDTFCPAIKKTG